MHIKLNNKKIIEQLEGYGHYKDNLESTEKIREQLEVEYKSIFNLAPNGIIKVDLKGFVTSCNEAFLEMAGYPREEIIGKHFTKLPTVKVKDVPRYIKIVASILMGKTVKPFVFEWIDRSGSIRLGEIHTALIKVNGCASGIMAVLWDITEREKTAAALHDSERNLKAYLECAPDAVYISDLKGTFLYGNKKAEELIGYKREELIGKSFLNLKLLPTKYLVKASELLALNSIGKPTGPDEFELVAKAGNRVWVEITTTPLKEQDRTVVIGFVRDITERKQADEKRQAILKTAMDGFWVCDLKGRLLEVNDSYCQMTGYTREELLKMSIQDIEAAETREEVARHIAKLMEQGHDSFETKHKRKDGRVIDIEISVNYFDAEKGQLFVFARDITERKQVEKVIKASEERYRLLVENANEAIIVAQDGMLKFANAKTAEFTGYSTEELYSMPFVKLIYIDDRDMVVERHNRRLKGDALPGIYTFRFVRKDGSVGWAEINAVLITWEGKPATLNFLSDITERKKSDEKLQQSFEKLRKTMDGTIETIALIAETRDPYTAGHQRRVAKLASAIATEIGLPEEQIETIRVAGILHDIGKVHVPTEILSKPGKLSDMEFNLIKSHPEIGHTILKTLALPWAISPIVIQHHERVNGSGYPKGLSGKDISLGAKVLAVADVIEAISSHRPYRPSLGIDKALEEITRNRGILYDADIVDACLRLINEKGFKFE